MCNVKKELAREEIRYLMSLDSMAPRRLLDAVLENRLNPNIYWDSGTCRGCVYGIAVRHAAEDMAERVRLEQKTCGHGTALERMLICNICREWVEAEIVNQAVAMLATVKEVPGII